MRRKEFETTDRQQTEHILKTADVGTLAFNGPDGFPRITPLNFAYDGRILWHGAVAGERFECLKKDPRATFSVYSGYLYLPSHLLSEENAASASAVFRSVVARGKARILNDPAERCAVLNVLMQKYQPEGKFRTISSGDAMYDKILKATAVYALDIEEVSGKFKLAQNKSPEDRRTIIAKLKKRNTPYDAQIADEIDRAN